MKKRLITICALISVLILLTGCAKEQTPNAQQPSPQPPNQQQPSQPTQPTQPNETDKPDKDKTTRTSLGGISLGDTIDTVEQKLGNGFKETEYEEQGYFPEAWIKREYNTEITVIYGKNSKKIFEVDTTNPKYKTNLGVKVGDNASAAFKTYDAKYQLLENRHGSGELVGFYQLDNGELMIFDLDKEDKTTLAESLSPKAKIEVIRLTRVDFVD